MTDYLGLGALHPFCVTWRNMHSRCYNPASNRYKTYGGRGIVVCPEWHTFSNFHAAMWASYKPGVQLDRKDNNGPYCQENCQWVSPLENTRKRTNSKLTAEQAEAIRRAFRPGAAFQETLAKQYGVSSRMIRYIASGDSWKK